MNRTRLACVELLALALACGLGPLSAQGPKHVDRPIIPARPDDVTTIEGIVKASYEVISGGVGVPRDWGRDRTLFDPNSHSVGIEVDPRTGAVTAKPVTEQEYADEADAGMVKNGFTERELAHVIHQYGNVATVLSSYETRTATSPTVAHGVNIFQLYFDGKRWWILSMVWDEQRPGNPQPPKLM